MNKSISDTKILGKNKIEWAILYVLTLKDSKPSIVKRFGINANKIRTPFNRLNFCYIKTIHKREISTELC